MRDPKSPATLAKAARLWANCLPGGPFGQPTEDDAHTADVAFEAALLEQGVISPSDVVESIEGGNGSIFVGLLTEVHTGDEPDTLFTCLRIDLDGNVSEEQ